METVRKRSISKEKLQPIIIIATLFLACLIFTIINPKFASASNIHSIFLTSVTVGIIAVGECCCIIAGYFDMSVSMVGAMSGLAAAFVIRATGSVMLSLVAGLCVGAVCGLAAGVLVACFKMNAFITTYALQSIYRGIIYILTNGIAISMTNSEYARLTRLGQMRVFGAIQFPIIVMIVVYVLGMLFLRYRRLGRSIYLVGGNSKCAQISGINLTMVRIVIFVLCDVLAALAGILFACRVATAQAFLADMIPRWKRSRHALSAEFP